MVAQPGLDGGKGGGFRINLLLRLMSALLALGGIYGCLWFDVVSASGWAWAFLVAVISLLSLREFYRLVKLSGVEPFVWFGYVLGPLWVLTLELDLSGILPRLGYNLHAAQVVGVIAVVGAMFLQLTRKSNDNSIAGAGLTVFGLLYCSYLPSFLLHLRHLQLSPQGWPMEGVEFVVVCVFVAKVADVGALVTGKRWGKHKLIPRLSPGKTWEGAAGGMVFSILLLQYMVWMNPAMSQPKEARLMAGFIQTIY